MEHIIFLVGLIVQIPGVILLYIAAIAMPWRLQTWSGETKKEKEYHRKRTILGGTGLTLVLTGYAFILIPYLTSNW